MALVASWVGMVVVDVHAQQAIHYVYDELNRLVGVVDQEGNVATYTYDAVGNLLHIERIEAGQLPGPVAITFVSPDSGKADTQVEIFGRGFSTVVGQNSVTFNGILATVSTAASNRLVASVPAGATTGHIAVTTPLGSALSPSPFRIPGELTVSPPTATVFASGTLQFEAFEDSVPTTGVRWTVNGIPGGDTSIGTISSEGLYQAPAIAPPFSVIISAVDVDDPAITASATVTIQPPLPVLITAAALSVGVAEPAPAVVESIVTRVSVRVTESPEWFAAGGPVSASREPVVTALSPAAAFPGTNVSIVVSGAGFGTISSIVFLLNNVPDPTIVAGNFGVNGPGTEVTADVTIDSSAPLGGRVVQILTADGNSTTTSTVVNVFTIE